MENTLNSLKITKKDEVLSREFGKFYEKKVMLELQIALQEKLDPNEMSAKKPQSFDKQGNAISYREIKRSEHILILQEELKNIESILETIEEKMK